MKPLITGSKGFLGSSLQKRFEHEDVDTVFVFHHASSREELKEACGECDFVYHFAGVLRPNKPEGYEQNIELTKTILEILRNKDKPCPVMFSSSIKAEIMDNSYGASKGAEEKLVRMYGNECSVPVFIYRFANIFGSGAKPYYTSVVATFSYSVSHHMPYTINDPRTQMKLLYLEDVMDELTQYANSIPLLNRNDELLYIKPVYQVSLGWLAYIIGSFACDPFSNPHIDMDDEFTRKLYTTYRSYAESTGE